ncbi:TRAP transporter large permease [Chloroflexota bacterium]
MDVHWLISLSAIVVVLFILLAIRVPIAFALGLVGFAGLFFFASPQIALDAIGQLFSTIPVNFVLLAIPLFIFMAEIIMYTGMGDDAYMAMDKLFSGTTGGLAFASIGAGVAFGAVTGSSVASAATIGPIAIGEMNKHGYKGSLAAGVVAASGGIAMLIPPSTSLIVYGFIAEVSVAKLFMAGIIPGVLLGVAFAAIVLILTKLDPSACPAVPALPLKERIFSLAKVWAMGVLAIIVLGSIYLGLATPTEAAAIGVLGSFIISFIYRKASWANLYRALMSAARDTAFIMFIIIGAHIFGFLISYLRIPLLFTQAVTNYNLSPILLLVSVNFLLLILGCLVDGLSLLLVVVPILLPSLLQASFNPIWLGIIFVLNIEMAILTPPIGLNLFVIHGISKVYGVTFGDVVRGASPFLLADLALMILMVILPDISLWLPRMLG